MVLSGMEPQGGRIRELRKCHGRAASTSSSETSNRIHAPDSVRCSHSRATLWAHFQGWGLAKGPRRAREASHSAMIDTLPGGDGGSQCGPERLRSNNIHDLQHNRPC